MHRWVALVWRRYGRPTLSLWRDPIGEMHVLMADWLERFIPQGDKEAQAQAATFGSLEHVHAPPCLALLAPLPWGEAGRVFCLRHGANCVGQYFHFRRSLGNSGN